MISLITWNSNLVPLFEGLCSSIPWTFEFSVFFFGFLLESNRRPRDWHSYALTNWASLTSSWISFIMWYYSSICVPWLINMYAMTHSYVSHDSFTCVTGLIYICDMAHYTCVTRLIHMWDMTHAYVWHDSFVCVTWLKIMCDMTHQYVWQDSFMRVIKRIHVCDMNHSYVWHDSFICVTRLIHTCDKTLSYVWHDASMCLTWLIHMCDDFLSNVTWLIHACALKHSYV